MKTPIMAKTFGALALVATTLLTACPDEGKRPLGSSCDSNELCESGLCAFGQCLDPDGDEDLDGLTNALEAALGSNPFNPDSDYDGVLDGAELATNLELVDTDGDGLPDILESLTRDADSDCLVDQLDPDDSTQADDLSAMKPVACNLAGVCGANLAVVSVSCPNDTKVATCDYTEVPGYEAVEVTCDGKDNDCDGRTDEDFPDANGNGIADCVDDDADEDGVVSATDNCPDVANPDQGDADGDDLGDACDLPGPVTLTPPSSPAASTAFTLTGTAEALVTLEFSIDNNCATSLGSGAADAAGRFSIAVTVAADTTVAIYVRATNRAGLASECRPTGVSLTSDLTAPAGPSATGLPAYTNLAAVLAEITGASEATTLTLYRRDVAGVVPRAGGCDGAPLLTAPITAGGSVPALIALVANRQNDLHGILVDRAGNASACTLLGSVVHDDVAPLAPSPNAATKALFAKANGGAAEALVGGCAESQGTVAFYLGSACGGAPVATTRADVAVDDCADGSGFAATLTVVASGSTTFSMQLKDRAGNPSACVALGAYVHDVTAPALPVVGAATAEVWGEDWVDFAVEGTSESGGQVILSSDPTCAPARGTAAVGADGRWATLVNVKTGDATLYALATDEAGNATACAPVATLFGTATVRLVSSVYGTPMVAQAVVFTDPAGDEAATVYTDEAGEAKLEVFAGFGATAVTYATEYSYFEWTSVVGLEPGQIASLEVYDPSQPYDNNPEFTVYAQVPPPPEGAVDYKILSACGRTYPSFEGNLGTNFQTWFDPDCTMEGDLSIVVEAIGRDGERLGFVTALHQPFPGEGPATVVFDGPWRTDYASFEVTMTPSGAPGPYRASHELGLHGDHLEDFWDVDQDGFTTPDADSIVTFLFPKFEHSVIGWTVALDHLGVGNQNASRSYTVRNEYAPGTASLDLARDLLPRLWSAEIVSHTSGPEGVTWTSEPGLAAQSDAMRASLYVSYEESINWVLLARPVAKGSLVFPKVRSLPGGGAFGQYGYQQFYGVDWVDVAEVKGFGPWARWCDDRVLQRCFDATSDSVTRTSSVRPPNSNR